MKDWINKAVTFATVEFDPLTHNMSQAVYEAVLAEVDGTMILVKGTVSDRGKNVGDVRINTTSTLFFWIKLKE